MSSRKEKLFKTTLSKTERILLWIAFAPIGTIIFRAPIYYFTYMRSDYAMVTSFPWYTRLVVDAAFSATILVVFITAFLIVTSRSGKKRGGGSDG